MLNRTDGHRDALNNKYLAQPIPGIVFGWKRINRRVLKLRELAVSELHLQLLAALGQIVALASKSTNLCLHISHIRRINLPVLA